MEYLANPEFKMLKIFIKENLILEDQVELRKEVEKVKEARGEGKWTIMSNRKVIITDRDKKDNNK